MIPAVVSDVELAQLNWAENWRLQVSKARDERKHELLLGSPGIENLPWCPGACGDRRNFDHSRFFVTPFPETADVAKQAEAKWRRDCGNVVLSKNSSRSSWEGTGSSLDADEGLEDWISAEDPNISGLSVRVCALACVHRGFRKSSHLAGLLPEEASWVQDVNYRMVVRANLEDGKAVLRGHVLP